VLVVLASFVRDPCQLSWPTLHTHPFLLVPQVLAAAREHDGLRSNSPLSPLVGPVSRLLPQQVFVRDVTAAISDENMVQVGWAAVQGCGVV